jgi:hypothetical protein
VPVPLSTRDPNYKQLAAKQKAYRKLYNGSVCLRCPDEYATLKNRQLAKSAAKCQRCPADQLPDMQHVFCGEQSISHMPIPR